MQEDGERLAGIDQEEMPVTRRGGPMVRSTDPTK